MTRTAEQILADRREADKRRFQRYKERQEAMGKRHVSGMISAEAYDLLSRERDRTGQSVAKILERALLGFYGKPEPVQEVIPETETIQPSLVDAEPDQEPEPVAYEDVQKTLALPIVEPEQKAVPVEPQQDKEPDADSIIIEMAAEQDQRGEKRDWKAIAEYLNGQEIKTAKGKEWKNDNVRMRYNALKKKPTS